MRDKNAVAEIVIWIFAVISFFVYVKSVFNEATILSYMTVFVYIVPQLVKSIDDFTSKYLGTQMYVINLFSIIIGGLVMSTSIVLMIYNITPHVILRSIMAIASAIFVVRMSWSIVNMMIQYLKIHINNNKVLKTKKGVSA